VNSTKTRVDPW